MVKVIVEYGDGRRDEAELPSGDFVVVACRWSDARDAIAGHLGSVNGIMRHWKAEELADQAVEALANSDLLMKPAAAASDG